MDANLHVDAHGELLGTSQLLRPSRLENMRTLPERKRARAFQRTPSVGRRRNKGPPLLQLLRSSTTVINVATLNYGYKCCDPPEGTRVPPLLRILAPPVGRRRVQGSPLCFNCYDPQLRL